MDVQMRFSTQNYLMIGVFSIIAAILLFNVGSSFAEVTGQQNTVLGVTFKAGGVIAGFLIIFLLSPGVIEKIEKIEQDKDFILEVAKQHESIISPLEQEKDKLENKLEESGDKLRKLSTEFTRIKEQRDKIIDELDKGTRDRLIEKKILRLD